MSSCQVTAVDAAELWFQGVHVTTSDTDLAWLYNIITNLAQQPIQDAITREVAAQVSSAKDLSALCPHVSRHKTQISPLYRSLHNSALAYLLQGSSVPCVKGCLIEGSVQVVFCFVTSPGIMVCR